jgi:hypothetical protein
MSRADGPFKILRKINDNACPFKILRKINDNAYKLELPPKFGVRTTLPSNSCIGRVRPPIWVIYICMER